MKSLILSSLFAVLLPNLVLVSADELELSLRYQKPVSEGSSNYHRLHRQEQWSTQHTAVVVCDMWDSHHCVNAVRRVAELSPRIDQFCSELRNRGATIIHAPSSCMAAYENHPARKRVAGIPRAKVMPDQIGSWCNQIPSEEQAAYPVDQSAGGEDDDPDDHRLWAKRLEAIGRNPRAPWKQQVDVIGIDPKRDYISDNGEEIWSILEHSAIKNVILVGVHTNMCVLGRPFGLRRLSAAGKNVVLTRDLTDTMYDPNAWPYASHFTGTDLIVSHVEKHVCPTIGSDQILGGQELRFRGDKRPRLAMIIAEDEYETDSTLPAFAAKHLSQHFSVSTYFGSETERHEIVGVEEIDNVDAILVSVRRRALSPKQISLLKLFAARGKPVIGIRTASHAFSLRGKPTPANKDVWPEFDADVFGGNYTNHYGNSLKATIAMPGDSPHKIIGDPKLADLAPAGSLYKVSPLAAGTHTLLSAAVEGHPPEPVAWTFIRNDGGRSFYTSLGHPDDFQQPEFETLLTNGILWACQISETTSVAATELQNERHANGKGSQ